MNPWPMIGMRYKDRKVLRHVLWEDRPFRMGITPSFVVYRSVISVCVCLSLAGCALAGQVQTTEQSLIRDSQTSAVVSGENVAATAVPATTGHEESELVNILIDRLGVDSRQAYGGIGAIFALAQQHMSPEDFMSLSTDLPDMDRYLDAVPSPRETRLHLGVDQYSKTSLPSGSGGLSALSGSFSDLGMGTELIDRFVAVVLQYLQDRKGLEAMSLLQNALY